MIEPIELLKQKIKEIEQIEPMLTGRSSINERNKVKRYKYRYLAAVKTLEVFADRFSVTYQKESKTDLIRPNHRRKRIKSF